MSVLVILLPPRPRDTGPVQVPADYAFVLSSDGASAARQGRAAADQLPRADSVCAVLPEADVSWQRCTVPKAPAARLRAALGAVLEEQLLDDDEAVHLALEPGAAGGQAAWVAVTHKAWLAALVADLERGGVPLDRVLPLAPPGPQPVLHALPAAHDGGEPLLAFSHADGAGTLRLGGSLARQWLATLERSQWRLTAHPAAVAVLERWAEAPVAVLGDAERALQALATPWNLRQFDLAPRHRGTQALREGWRRFLSPGFRPVRWGAGALVLVQLVGLNAWAWHERREIGQRRDAMVALLQKAHPQVRAVLDAPVQMSRETDLLRVAAGQPGDTDLETLLNAAAAAWPPGAGPATTLRFEPGRLLFTAPEWGPEQTDLFRSQLRATGWSAEEADGGLAVSRGAGGRS